MPASCCLACQGPLADEPTIVGRDRMHGLPGSFPVHACRRCGSGTTLPLATEEELPAFYPSVYPPHERSNGLLDTAMASMQRARNRRFPLAAIADGRPSPGELLDVGCGRGDLAASWIERGWRVSGVEPSPAAAAIARMRGADVSEGTLATVRLPAQAFDAIVFRHSLEHVVDPRLDLRRAFAALRPGGTLTVIVPNWGSWQRRAFGQYWFPLELPRHRTHFTAEGIRVALADAGFTAIDVRAATPFITTTWSLQFRLFGRLLTDRGLPLLAGYAASVPIGLVSRALDGVLGGGDFLHGAAQRPAL